MTANHLINEKSPYLQQHAYNPVDWYPWGEEAFEKAQAENKPIFLSIGYSTCHWCHVMEKESFTNPKIAEILNEKYVAIKIDREERPDVDKIYMTAVQAMTGSGGWPLNVWLTPGLKPFFGGTYFPPEDRLGRAGLERVLLNIAGVWSQERSKLTSSGESLTASITQYLTKTPQPGTLNPSLLKEAFEDFQKDFDEKYGGFGGAPKFPMPVNLNFLLRYEIKAGKALAQNMAFKTLEEMAKGGLYDHLGGGFHRYSTDERWHVPHFEKMLYDNAQLAVNYLEAYQISGRQEFLWTAQSVLDYLLRDMKRDGGGFYSAEDADSEGKEGAFYVWSKEEILKLLGKEKGEIFSHAYGVLQDGNAQHDPQEEFKGKNILYRAQNDAQTAKKFSKKETEIHNILDESRKKLKEARDQRPRPHLDDKILTSWNGLTLSALAKGAQILEDKEYLQAAVESAEFIRKELYDPKAQRLYRRWREGERKVTAMADDYAFLIQGLLDLFEASQNAQWLEWAMELQEQQNASFYDNQNGGFYTTSKDHDRRLLVRIREDFDNVEPSASSVSTLNLLRLAQYSDRNEWGDMAKKTLESFSKSIQDHPRSFAQMMVAFIFQLEKPQQIIIAGAPESPDTLEMMRAVRRRFLPRKILILADGGDNQAIASRYLPIVANMHPIRGKSTAYVCVNYACDLPVNELKAFERLLDSNSR